MPRSIEAENRPQWEYLLVEDLSGGVDVSRGPELIEDRYSPDMSNVVAKRRRVSIDTGYRSVGTSVIGNPRISKQFKRKDGTSEQILVTDLTVYKWSSSNMEWELITSGTSTTLSGNEASGQTVLSVVSETGFSANDPIGITLNSGAMHVSTVASTTAGEITINDALPSDADSGNTVIQGRVLAGSADIQPDCDVLPSNDWFVFTNGVDTPQRYDGTDVGPITSLTAAFTTFTARTVEAFNNYLMFANTEENGTAFPQRVRNSDVADPTDWTSGDAGSKDLLDTEGHILRMAKRGPYCIIYKEDSIIRREFVGAADQLFNDDTVVEGQGLLSTQGVVVTDKEHFVVGTSNILRYAGGFEVDPIGDRVFDKLFSADLGEITPGEEGKTMLLFVKENSEVWVIYNENRCLRYDIKDGTWFQRDFSITLTGVGLFSSVNSLPWSALIGTWAEQVGSWSSKTLGADSPVVHLLDGAGDAVFEYDFSTPQDNGTDISYRWVSKDFGFPDRESRSNYFDFKLKGSSISIEYSIDEGDTYVSLGTVSPGAVYTKVRIYRQVIFRVIRFRLSGDGGGFTLEWIGMARRDETQRGT